MTSPAIHVAALYQFTRFDDPEALKEPLLAACEGAGVKGTLLLAREMHPGQRNSLDALCKRYGVDNSKRDLHGALLDARILADVYLAMTGGQSALALIESAQTRQLAATAPMQRPPGILKVVHAAADELSAHEAMLDRIAKASGGKALFR